MSVIELSFEKSDLFFCPKTGNEIFDGVASYDSPAMLFFHWGTQDGFAFVHEWVLDIYKEYEANNTSLEFFDRFIETMGNYKNVVIFKITFKGQNFWPLRDCSTIQDGDTYYICIDMDYSRSQNKL